MLRRGAYYALIISGQNNALFVSFRLLRFAEKSAIIIAQHGGVHGFDGDHGCRISESKPRASLKSGKLKNKRRI